MGNARKEGGRGKKGLMRGYKGRDAPWGGKKRGRRKERKNKEEHKERVFRHGTLGVKTTRCVIVWMSKICHHDVLNTATCCPLQWGFKCPHSLPTIYTCVCACVHGRACAWQQMLVQWRNPTSPGKNGREMLPIERGRERERERGEGGRDGARRKTREEKEEESSMLNAKQPGIRMVLCGAGRQRKKHRSAKPQYPISFQNFTSGDNHFMIFFFFFPVVFLQPWTDSADFRLHFLLQFFFSLLLP